MLEYFADDVRRMTPGATIARVQRTPVSVYADKGDDDRRSFNAYVTKLRGSTGFDLVVETLAAQVVGDNVIRCFTVTRLA